MKYRQKCKHAVITAAITLCVEAAMLDFETVAAEKV